MSDSFVTPRTIDHQTPLSMGFPRQDYCSVLLFPSPGDIPRLDYKRLWLLSCLILSWSEAAGCHVVSCLMERSTRQGTEGGHQPTAREELIPKALEIYPSLFEPWDVCSLWELLNWLIRLSCAWIPDSQNLCDHKCSKTLSVGVIFYALKNNEFRKEDLKLVGGDIFEWNQVPKYHGGKILVKLGELLTEASEISESFHSTGCRNLP